MRPRAPSAPGTAPSPAPSPGCRARSCALGPLVTGVAPRVARRPIADTPHRDMSSIGCTGDQVGGGREPADAAGPRRHGPRLRPSRSTSPSSPGRLLLRGALHPEFKATFGETPHRYLQRRRVERAMYLLRTTDRTSPTSAWRSGSRSLGHLQPHLPRHRRRDAVGIPRAGPDAAACRLLREGVDATEQFRRSDS